MLFTQNYNKIELGFYKLKEGKKKTQNNHTSALQNMILCLLQKKRRPPHWASIYLNQLTKAYFKILRYTMFLYRPGLSRKTKHRLLELTLRLSQKERKKKKE